MELDNETVYFSYFNNRKTRQLNLKRLSIANSCFENDIEVYKDLLVPLDLFKDYKQEKITLEQLFSKYLIRVLLNLNPEKVFNDCKGKVLVCHEVEGCHREMVKIWLEQSGYKCIELPR